MKKTFILFLLACLFVASMLLVSCNNDKETDSETVLPPTSDHEHWFSSWETLVYPTFESKGLEQRECLRCKGVEKKAVSKMTFAEDLEFELNYANQTYSVAYNNSYEGRYVAIPSTYNGLPVVSISNNAFNGNKNIKYVIIPNSVTQIGEKAFSNCNSLTKVFLPDSIITINAEAFANSFKLKKIVIPDSVKILGQNAFYECTGLEEVVIGRGLEKITADFSYPFDGMFGKCYSLKNVTIPDTITIIGDNAFAECSSLESITIPDSVHTIGNAAFRNCTSLKEIKLGNGVKKIGSDDGTYGYVSGTFSGCKILEKITLSNSIQTIYADAFEYCNSLANVYYEGDIEDWCKINFSNKYSNPASNATNLYFNGELVSDIVIPDSITVITAYVFSGYKGLKSVTISDSVTSIEKGAFMHCASLESVVIPNSVQVLGIKTFSNCKSLQSIVIPASIKIIGSGAFEYCDMLEKVYFEGELEDWCKINFDGTNNNPLSKATYFYVNEELITDITIPNSITNVNSYLFAGYKSLKSVTFPEHVEKVGRYAFSNCTSLENITVYRSDILIDMYAFDGVQGIKFNEYDNAFYIGNENNPYLMLFKAKRNSTLCEIHPSTSIIYGRAFEGCGGMTSIYIPDSVEVIGERAFLCSSLDNVRISNNLKIMEGENIFSITNSSLYNLYNGSKYLGNEDNPYLLLASYKADNNVDDCILHPDTKIIGAGAFVHNSYITTITIPDSVEVICYRAFGYCSKLKKLYIPDSVTTVGADLFAEFSNATIYCEADSIPSGWDDDWRLGHTGVVYTGYTKE